MNETTWLAGFLNKQREIIEAAETPFAKLAIFILPVLAPMVPATLTGLHIFKLLLEVFTFTNALLVSVLLSVVVAIVLELLGYVGAISFIQSLFLWIRTRKDEYLLPFVLNGMAYIFYLVAMYLINVQLGKYFKTPDIVNNIVGLLSFITVPTSLLAANHLSLKEEKEEETKESELRRVERIEKYKIKHGAIPVVYEHSVPQVEKQHNASDYKNFVFEKFDDYNGNISLTDITALVNKEKRVRLIHASVKGTWYKWLKEWKRTNQSGGVS